jgi:hypothetical protein
VRYVFGGTASSSTSPITSCIRSILED